MSYDSSLRILVYLFFVSNALNLVVIILPRGNEESNNAWFGVLFVHTYRGYNPTISRMIVQLKYDNELSVFITTIQLQYFVGTTPYRQE
jgi:hypothetical protein